MPRVSAKNVELRKAMAEVTKLYTDLNALGITDRNIFISNLTAPTHNLYDLACNTSSIRLRLQASVIGMTVTSEFSKYYYQRSFARMWHNIVQSFTRPTQLKHAAILLLAMKAATDDSMGIHVAQEVIKSSLPTSINKHLTALTR